MITLFLIFMAIIVFTVLGLCLHLAGGVIRLAFKLVLCLPCAVLCVVFGVILCCTLILIPLGVCCFKLAGWLLNPFRSCVV